MATINELKAKYREAQAAAQEAWEAHTALVDRFERGENVTHEDIAQHLDGCQAFEDEKTAAYNELQAAYQQEIDWYEKDRAIASRYITNPDLIEFYS